MTSMFERAEKFNKDLNNWNVSNVVNMNYTFFYAASFQKENANWKISKETNNSGMFR